MDDDKLQVLDYENWHDEKIDGIVEDNDKNGEYS